MYPVRPSLLRLTDLPCCKHSQSRVIRLSHDPKADLLWWPSFPHDLIILSLSICPRCLTVSDLQVSKNATGAVALGVHLDGLLVHRLLSSRKTVFKALPFLVLANKYGTIRVQFFYGNFGAAPMGCSWISYPACSSGPFHSLSVSDTDVSGRPQLNRYALSRSLVCRMLLPPPGFSSNNPPSRSSPRRTELTVFHPRVNCFPDCQPGFVPLPSTTASYPFLFPVSEMFVEHLVSSVSYRSVKSYLCAFRSLRTELCNGDSTSPRLAMSTCFVRSLCGSPSVRLPLRSLRITRC